MATKDGNGARRSSPRPWRSCADRLLPGARGSALRGAPRQGVQGGKGLLRERLIDELPKSKPRDRRQGSPRHHRHQDHPAARRLEADLRTG